MWHKSIGLVLLVTLGLAVLAGVTQAQENMALNPSFEEDEVILDDPAWEMWATWGWEGGLTSQIAFDDTEFIDGTRSLRIEPKGGTNWYFIVLNLPIPTQNGKKYTASFWVKAEAPRSLSAKWKANDNTVDWGPVDFEVTSEWAEYHMTAVALSDSTKVEFHCAAVDTPFWLDFVWIY
jgi:hypothetical protein